MLSYYYLVEPLALLNKAYDDGRIEKRLYKSIMDRIKYVREGIVRIEKASGIEYPEYYIEPSMVTSISSSEVGILFARTIPMMIDNSVRIIIELTAPLVAFGLRGTIHAILAHEFLHYLELIAKIIRMDIISDEISYSLFESRYMDEGRVLDAKAVFRERSLIRLLLRKMGDGLNDERLEKKSIQLWLKKGYPTKSISVEDNITRLSIDAIINTHIDERLETRVREILARTKKPPKRD